MRPLPRLPIPPSPLPREASSDAEAGYLAKQHARRLRRQSSIPERVLWSMLRNHKLAGLKFRRQHPIGPYYADFYCDQARLVVELDSSWHDARKEHDEARDTYMNSHGFRVLRISVSLLAQNQDGVRRRIEHAARQAIEENRVARADAGGRAEAQKNR